uniref:Mediator of RNA polymerase II transcription subunit 7 n=1 Tax=Caenorhabditis tropicalis TaxID=1561998 RepID=A0A1I7TN53_9PELO
MSSESAFKVPYPKFYHPLVTQQEAEDLSKRLSGLKKLIQKPRANLPELQPFLHQLIQALHALVMSSTCQYTPVINLISDKNPLIFFQEARQIAETGFRTTKMLEDVVIRTIVSGDSPRVVYEASIAELQKSGLLPRESSPGTSSSST